MMCLFKSFGPFFCWFFFFLLFVRIYSLLDIVPLVVICTVMSSSILVYPFILYSLMNKIYFGMIEITRVFFPPYGQGILYFD